MDVAFHLSPLLLTLMLRQVLEAGLRPPAAKGTSQAGRASVVIWYLAYSVMLMLALERLWPAALGDQPWWGYLLMWSGIVLRLLALHRIGRYYDPLIRIRDDHRLIDSGPYRWLRHPLHLGLHVEMAGLAVLADHLAAWLLLGIALLVLIRRNIEEERALEKFFALAYGAYRGRAWDVIDMLPVPRKT
jgi:protein-S-isoprenylcysteine O-methyltransferase Ste14